MKVTLNWLKRHVDFDWSAEELKERLTMLGIEVEGVQKLGGEFENVVVAQVMTCDKHPNADKLSVCKVDDGRTQRQIVCGATNFKVGDKVPLALPGCVIPTPAGSPPFVIKVGKLRGVESQGMMCSGEELGLSVDASGLMILPADARVGQSFAEFLGKTSGDVVYDLEITPNRPDLNSVIGIAREIAALTGHPLKWPELKPLVEVTPNTNGQDVNSQIRVRIEDGELCPRYTARVVRGVKVGPSPAWLKEMLEKVGIRSISNVVDVTNFVMLESGQPLHAFDLHLIARKSPGELPAIVVRRAGEGEKFTTLDGQQRTLTNQMLVIADEVHAVALAGVMGGLNSEIKDSTADVLIESACFQPQSIRATSKKLDLRSDASYRYERGSDVCICDWASRRAVDLILETSGGQAVAGVVDAFPTPHTAKEITLRFEKTNALLGVDIAADQQIAFLKNLGLELVRVEGTVSAVFRIPSFRVDLKREADLIEEVARIYGVEKIPSRAPACVAGSHPYDQTHNELAEARRLLTGLGLDETQGQTLLSEAVAKLVCAEPVYLQNALSADMTVLRPSLLPGLLEAFQRNLNRKNGDLAFFEIGRVFGLQNGQLAEERRVAVALTGLRAPGFWSGAERNAQLDLYDLKGALETFLEQFGLRGVTYNRRLEPTPLYIESATIQLGKMALGEMGQLQPALAKKYDLRNGAFFAELNMDLLLARRNTTRQFRPLPQFPSVRRDVAMVVPEAITHDAVLSAVKQARVQNLDAVELFDVFRGQNVPEGHKSLAYAFTYRNAERTLTDAEVNTAHTSLVEQFKISLQAVMREG